MMRRVVGSVAGPVAAGAIAVLARVDEWPQAAGAVEA